MAHPHHTSSAYLLEILNGRLKVGMTHEEIEYLDKAGQAVIKTSRRDIPFIVAQKADGATTVASTMILAAMASIKVFATGGIGGVHRGAQQTFDISADLQELANTDVAVICAGAKSILDIGLTLEYLETQGVSVIGYQTDMLPAFYTRESYFHVDYRLDEPKQIAAAMTAKWQMGLKGGMVIANPIPAQYALDKTMIDQVIKDAVAEMNEKGISGKASTPGRDRECFLNNLTLKSRYDLILPFFGSTPCILTASKRISKQ
ncbi:pseudouridine-5'-phosphate glycosidase [Shewanella algicola]|uniref:pseudouridine-5'-phosphate glycosidase n=1 Tax=Shewanella algicola TaxID=640633 RepID=UPI0024955481|nr:pseudouridine-5'-phosphate glycosidase [Shewanella algicola]